MFACILPYCIMCLKVTILWKLFMTMFACMYFLWAVYHHKSTVPQIKHIFVFILSFRSFCVFLKNLLRGRENLSWRRTPPVLTFPQVFPFYWRLPLPNYFDPLEISLPIYKIQRECAYFMRVSIWTHFAFLFVHTVIRAPQKLCRNLSYNFMQFYATSLNYYSLRQSAENKWQGFYQVCLMYRKLWDYPSCAEHRMELLPKDYLGLHLETNTFSL